jgi:hypothetical protein
MNKEFIPYEQALELKELGFDEPCFGYYSNSKEHLGEIWYEMPNKGQDYIPVGDILAPLKSQFFKWVREKYKFNHSIIFHKHPFGTDDYQYLILLDEDEFVETGFNTYEEAELACLKKLIEIVKEKK